MAIEKRNSFQQQSCEGLGSMQRRPHSMYCNCCGLMSLFGVKRIDDNKMASKIIEAPLKHIKLLLVGSWLLMAHITSHCKTLRYNFANIPGVRTQFAQDLKFSNLRDHKSFQNSKKIYISNNYLVNRNRSGTCDFYALVLAIFQNRCEKFIKTMRKTLFLLLNQKI